MKGSTIWLIAVIDKKTGRILHVRVMFYGDNGCPSDSNGALAHAALTWIRMPDRAAALVAMDDLLKQSEWAWTRPFLDPEVSSRLFGPPSPESR